MRQQNVSHTRRCSRHHRHRPERRSLGAQVSSFVLSGSVVHVMVVSAIERYSEDLAPCATHVGWSPMQPVRQSQSQPDWVPRTVSQPSASSLTMRNPRIATPSRSGLLASRSLRLSHLSIDSPEQPHSRSDQHEQEAKGLATWNFSRIPVFPPDQPNGRQPASLLSAPSLPVTMQPRLAVGPVDDPLEREAGIVADRVMRTPDADSSMIRGSLQLSQQSATGEKTQPQKLQTERLRSPEAAANEMPGVVHEVLRTPGQPLDASTRAVMEPRFGHDFSRVRLHTDSAAAESAKAVNARAYAVGRDVVFAPQMYAPHSSEGRMLLAHELAHTIQQSAAAANARLVQRQPDKPAAEVPAASSSPNASHFQDLLSKDPAMGKAYTPIHGATGAIVGYSRTADGYIEVRNTDGEIVYSDELPLEHGLPIIDAALDLVEKGLKQLGYVAVGTLDAVLENNWRALGLPVDDAHKQPIAQRLGIPLDAKAYKLGRGAGHALTLLETAEAYVGGATLFLSGAAEFIAGVAATPAGGVGLVVLPVALVQVAAGSTAIIYGGALGRATLVNMMSQEGGSEPAADENGPYADIKDNTKIAPRRPFQDGQKTKIRAANKARNNGQLRSDDPLDPIQVLKDPEQARGGIPSDPAMAEVDHIIPESAGGTNSYGNARVISKLWNNILRAKGAVKAVK